MVEYMANATGGEQYDFKRQGIEDRPDGQTEVQHMYRAMPIDGTTGLPSSSAGWLPTIATAGDVGNIAAGYVAGDNGLKWQQARFGFDALQSWQSSGPSREIQTTQKAERVGYNLGVKNYERKHPFKSFLSPPGAPFPPR